MNRLKQLLASDLVVILGPLIVYLVTTWPLWEWIVDDAGITFSYARSLAQGHGLVAQPGLEPVEGFSNPLWLLLMSVFFLVRMFDPYVVPKLVGLLLVGIAYWLLHRSMMRLTSGQTVVSLVALVCLSLNASFTVWTCSGLENSLWVALAALLLRYLISYDDQSGHTAKQAVITGVIVCGMTLTRPDGIVYGWVFPALLVALHWGSDRHRIKECARQLTAYLVTIVAIMGLVTTTRLAYFGLWLPHTYYVKGGPSLEDLWLAVTLQQGYLEKCHLLLVSVFGVHLWYVIPGLTIVAFWACFGKRANRRPRLPLLMMMFTSYMVFMVLPNDWMREYRFATPFLAFYYVMVAVMGWHLINMAAHRPLLRNIIGMVATGALILVTLDTHVPRLRSFYRWPVVPFGDVAKEYAFRFNGYSEDLRITDGSVLLPDVGGTLYYSDLRVIDLGCLCDTTIARTLLKDQSRFYDYVFDEARPTFIHVHGTWTLRADLDADPRFRRDYVAIKEYPDEWVKKRSGRDLMSGHFVRQDQVRGQEELLDRLSKE